VIDGRFTIVAYKPTVYSHKQQRAGVIEGSGNERMQMTKDLLYLFDIETIPHSYLYIGKQYILCLRIDPSDVPPIEVIVKRCCVGTDKHRYYEI
jgi:hypothetical protein